MKNKEIEELLNNIKDKYSYEPYDTTGKVYTTISYEEGQLLLSCIEQLEQKCESLLENKNETLRYISNYLTLDQRFKWNDNVDEKLKLVKNFLNGREKTKTNISYEDLLRKNKQLENNRDKAIEEIDNLLVYNEYSDTTKGFGNVPEQLKFYLSDYDNLEDFRKSLKGDSDD